MQGKKEVTKDILIDRMLVQNIFNSQANPKIDSKTFVFIPPAGSAKVEPPNGPPTGRGK
jgi:hypothetical protein